MATIYVRRDLQLDNGSQKHLPLTAPRITLTSITHGILDLALLATHKPSGIEWLISPNLLSEIHDQYPPP